MKTKIFITFLFTAVSTLSTMSQNEKKFDYEFLGVLLLSKSQLYSYKLEFNMYKDSIKGYSYTDLTGPHETKSYIYGTYSKRTNEIEFEEKDVLYTKSNVSTDEFCFITSKGYLKLKSRKNSFDGSFTGKYSDGEVCAEGKVRLVGRKFIEKKLKKVYKKIKKKKRIDSITKEKVAPDRVLKKFGKTSLSENENITIYMNAKQVKLEIWDYGKEDGDIIDVYMSDKKIISNLKVQRKKKKLLLNLKKGNNVIKIKTINAGTIKTNTAKIKIYNKSRFYELTSDISVDKSAQINIFVKE
ncbi:hypothetical protein VBY74_05195 [Tenacibaculum ascidiaceicola]|uniref:hypothetical protein n=1 Tax=Tenacibaculum ascidiaceicola TaxID=1699411 RepID=UPI0039EBD43A